MWHQHYAQKPHDAAAAAAVDQKGGFKPLICNASMFPSVCAGFRSPGPIRYALGQSFGPNLGPSEKTRKGCFQRAGPARWRFEITPFLADVQRTPISRVWVSLSTNRRYTAEQHTPQDPPPHNTCWCSSSQNVEQHGHRWSERGVQNPSFATPACFRAFARGFDLRAPSGTLCAPLKKHNRAVFRGPARHIGASKSRQLKI